jgi:hypothetical protein
MNLNLDPSCTKLEIGIKVRMDAKVSYMYVSVTSPNLKSKFKMYPWDVPIRHEESFGP